MKVNGSVFLSTVTKSGDGPAPDQDEWWTTGVCGLIDEAGQHASMSQCGKRGTIAKKTLLKMSAENASSFKTKHTQFSH